MQETSCRRRRWTISSTRRTRTGTVSSTTRSLSACSPPIECDKDDAKCRLCVDILLRMSTEWRTRTNVVIVLVFWLHSQAPTSTPEKAVSEISVKGWEQTRKTFVKLPRWRRIYPFRQQNISHFFVIKT